MDTLTALVVAGLVSFGVVGITYLSVKIEMICKQCKQVDQDPILKV